MNVIIVHGGAGDIGCGPPRLEPLEKAALAGCGMLEKSPLDAVERVVMALEEDPLFNAGYGSVLNLDGVAEMDAAVMDGASGGCGAVTAIREVRNPVCVARRVMEETPHVVLAGDGAMRFARGKGFDYFDPVMEKQRDAWKKAVEARERGEETPACAFTGLSPAHDTVGGIAVGRGRVVAASSTGGVMLKLPGRVGDTGTIGAGIYATSRGAAVCTGLGEVFIRLNIAAWAVNLLAQGVGVQEAARAAIRRLAGTDATGGILVADAGGNTAAVYNSAAYPVVLIVDGQPAREFIPEKI
ncbi:MAG: isoaspartyl peptidase/L-asparaginase [Firmicutes bacterium]|nr:isoaspartyl peptidase/L-asparaginase [Bacillota bacterium]